MNAANHHQAFWLKDLQNKVWHIRAAQKEKSSPFSEEAIVEAAEKNLHSYLKRVEKKLIRKAKSHKIFVQISGYSEYRIMFFYKSNQSGAYKFIKVPHHRNKLYDVYSSPNQKKYNDAYLAAARKELGIDVDTLSYFELPL